MPAILIKCAHRRKPAASAFRGHSVNGQTSDSNFWPVNFAKCSATAELYVTAVRIRYGLRPRIIVRTRGEQLKELSPGFVQRPPSNYPSHGVHFSQDDGATIYSDTYS
ncbi:uncharacterized protein LOC128259665 isoform X2 [Drosophila gunungcola]|uniref:uncharacterized protein LOC128259665 isoform X2 n=1 Tax=Drosophila gunungcola TaxID=103775 RepID=UPI0022E58904|nr:uncharacterized protein LOC128259665 isoform X2 [Drosophila gunungcola]